MKFISGRHFYSGLNHLPAFDGKDIEKLQKMILRWIKCADKLTDLNSVFNKAVYICFFYLMEKLYLLLGSNLGDRSGYLAEARRQISAEIGPLSEVSALYETEPWGNADQGRFLNQVVCLDSDTEPLLLLGCILDIEQRIGRTRSGIRNEARLIDIDILFFGDRIIRSAKLSIPHPLLHNRRFTLVPLHEIAPQLIHPVLKKSVAELLDICEDPLMVSLFGKAD